MQIVLIGLRGSGKTTLGRALAQRAGRTFIDLDDLTPARLGCASVREAWAAHGEPAFRAAEADALADVLGRPGTVLALGGGTPTAPGAADRLRAARSSGGAWLAYLRASAADLRVRLAGTDIAQRPALMGADALGEIGAVLAARDGLYLGLADAVVEVGGLSPLEAEAALEGAARRCGVL
ncbi:MAG: shikimate kinase II [Phycisphaerae bacterium]|nr:shikimate kinase II [Phycisphaerae bacterium]